MRAFVRDESGATSIEYGLIAIIISVGIIVSLNAFAGALSDLWFFVSNTIDASI